MIVFSAKQHLYQYGLDIEKAKSLFYFVNREVEGLFSKLLSNLSSIDEVSEDIIADYLDLCIIEENRTNDDSLNGVGASYLIESIVKDIKGLFNNKPNYVVMDIKHLNDDIIFLLEEKA